MTLTVPSALTEESYFPFLLRRIVEGSQDAEHELSLHFSRGICYSLARRLGPDRAAELADGVFAAVIEAIRNGEICDPNCLTMYVRGEVQRTLAAEEAPPRLNTAPDRDQLTAARLLRSLPPSHREALLRYYHEAQPVEQICRDLGLTRAQFRAIHDRAKNNFKNI
jgi:DNA-directed RNA polymerase specialized sigma24 family protein